VNGRSQGIEARSIERFEEGSSIPLSDPRIAGFMVATETASDHPDTGAVLTTVSAPVLQSPWNKSDISFAQRRVLEEQPLLLSMLENDAFYF